MYADRTINCLDCGQEFSFTAGEQEFYSQRGFTEPPKRCPGCRAARKAQRPSGAYAGYGGYAASGGYGGNGATGDGGSGYGAADGYTTGYSSTRGGGYPSENRERREREMFEATCADCGKTASVPFRPSGVRPVYCSDCFQTRR